MEQRLQKLAIWANDQLESMGLAVDRQAGLIAVSGDASFRRYFRVYAVEGLTKQSFILMDAPPEKESCDAYIHVAQALEVQGLRVPHLYSADLSQGFLLLSDLGDELYLSHLNTHSAPMLYQSALQALLQIQQCSNLADELPLYDERLLRNEMLLFTDWFCIQLLELSLTDHEKLLIDEVFGQLVASALAQPQVCVHRDYHSRNLMVLPEGMPGILDFQDAVKGPITYDLVSLLKDCYIAWPAPQVRTWVLEFAQQLHENQQITNIGHDVFLHWFDWMGLQRHLKVLGIFSRLNLRDHKPRYLHDIPLVFDYVLDVTSQYPTFSIFHDWLQTRVLPRWNSFYQTQGNRA